MQNGIHRYNGKLNLTNSPATHPVNRSIVSMCVCVCLNGCIVDIFVSVGQSIGLCIHDMIKENRVGEWR